MRTRTLRRGLRTVTDFVDCVGNTPLLRLREPSKLTGCEIYGKCEFLNPGGSVKDRAALGIVQAAERSGVLKPGGAIVEGTAGNTGLSPQWQTPVATERSSSSPRRRRPRRRRRCDSLAHGSSR